MALHALLSGAEHSEADNEVGALLKLPKWVFALTTAMQRQGRLVSIHIVPEGGRQQYLASIELDDEEGKSSFTAHTALCEFFNIPLSWLASFLGGSKLRPVPVSIVASVPFEVLGSSSCDTPTKLLDLFEMLGLHFPAPKQKLNGAGPSKAKGGASDRRWGKDLSDKKHTSTNQAVQRLHYAWDVLQQRAELLARARPAVALLSSLGEAQAPDERGEGYTERDVDTSNLFYAGEPWNSGGPPPCLLGLVEHTPHQQKLTHDPFTTPFQYQVKCVSEVYQ